MKQCSFINRATKLQVSVNPETVRNVFSNPAGGTDIFFDDGTLMTVDGKVGAVIDKLKETLP